MQTRDYLYVGDAVRAFLSAGEDGRPGTWNIGMGVEVSVLSLATIIGDVAGQEMRPRFAPPRAGELRRSAIAVDRAAGELGWHATTPLAEGVRSVYRWIEAGAHDRAPLGPDLPQADPQQP
jgi:UDP-glucose 4-epimerase